MLSLLPIDWNEAVRSTNSNAPYIGETIDAILCEAQAVVVLLTGDDVVQLRSEFYTKNDSEDDRVPFLQPRLNVLFEAGMVLSHSRLAPRTILVEVGKMRICHALAGRHRITLSNKMEDRWDLVRSLQKAGCAVEIPSNELLRQIGDFNFEYLNSAPGS